MKNREKERCLLLMMDVLKVLKSAHEHEEIFYRTIDVITRVLPVQSVAVVLIDSANEYLKIESAYGISHEFQKTFRRKISTGAVGELIWNGKQITIQDPKTDPAKAEEVRLEHEFGSCICVPIGSDHRSIGYLAVTNDLTYAFNQEDQMFLEACADVMGIAHQKAWLTQENLRLDRIDHETGLEKFAAFQEHLQTALDRGLQFRETFALILCDVDNFKSISHTYGYAASRQLLGALGTIVRKNARSMDASARYGFDEFIVLRENTDPRDAQDFAEALRKDIEETAFSDRGIRTTVSVGVAVFPQNGLTADDLMITAKKAMFAAQKSGRNRVVTLPSVWYEKHNEDLTHTF